MLNQYMYRLGQQHGLKAITSEFNALRQRRRAIENILSNITFTGIGSAKPLKEFAALARNMRVIGQGRMPTWYIEGLVGLKKDSSIEQVQQFQDVIIKNLGNERLYLNQKVYDKYPLQFGRKWWL